MKSPLWLLAAPVGIPVAALVFTGQWWLALGIAALVITLGSVAAALHFGGENVDLRAGLQTEEDAHEETARQLHNARAENARLSNDNMRMALQLSDARVVVPIRRVPEQRDGEHDRLALSRAEWEAIERETRDL